MKAKDFMPKVKGKSDFYSWQLYKWMKKKPDFCRIYEGVWNSATGYDPNRIILYIGLLYDDCFMGSMLRRICTVGAKLDSMAYCSKGHHLDEWQDVTDSFFADYRKRGVCAIHGGMAHKWTYDVELAIRTCEYCGEKQEKKTVMVPKDVWENVL